MGRNGPRGRWRQRLLYAFTGLIAAITVSAAVTGIQWYWTLGGFCTVSIVALGRRRIFRPGVTRTGSEIVCRYIPWYEGNVYGLNVVLPLLGVAMVAAGYAQGNPAWLRWGGFFLLAITPLCTFAAIRMWRRCFLRITPSALTVRLAAPKDKPFEIRRECVESVLAKVVPNGVGGASPQVEITYRPMHFSSDATETVLLGLQLSVQPTNLFKALWGWREVADADPVELMDGIERILRGTKSRTA